MSLFFAPTDGSASRYRDRGSSNKISRRHAWSTTSRRARMRVAAVVEQLETRQLLSAIVQTNYTDYSPGSTAYITAKPDGGADHNFLTGEKIQFLVTRTDGIPVQAPPAIQTWNVTDGDTTPTHQDANGVWWYPDADGVKSGSIDTSWYVDPQFAGASLRLTATGQTSNAVATTYFTASAKPQVTSILTNTGVPGTTFNVTFTGSGFQTSGNNATTVSFSGTGITVNSYTRTSTTSISANITVSGTAALGARDVTISNGNSQGNSTTVNNGFMVAKANQTITFGALVTKTYGDPDFVVSATASSDLPVTFSIIAGAGFASLSGNTVHITGAGAVTIEATQTGDSTYNSATPVHQMFTITKAALTVTAANKSKTYGDFNPTLDGTLTGVVNGDAITASYSTTANRFSDVVAGGYAITATLSDPNSRLSNYTVTNTSGTLTINPAILTVTADAKSKVYGSADPALTYVASGFRFSDTVGSVLSGGLTRTAGEHVASYAISQGTLAANSDYTISFTGNTLVITPAPLTIAVNNATKVYGAALPTLSASYIGLVNGDSMASLAARPSITTAASAASPVLPGGYAIIAWGCSDPDYAISYQPGTLLITPAPLTITANNASMVQGAAVLPLSASYNGLINGDCPANLTTPPTLTTQATPLSPAGTYPIVAGGASSPNYVINYGSGVVVVNPALVRVLNVSIHAVRLGKTKRTTQVIVLQFSGALNPGGAQRTNSYSLSTIPANKRQKSQSVSLSQAQYNAASNTVTLVTRKPLVLNPPLKLTLSPESLLDSYNRPMSGNCMATLSKRGVAL